LFFTLTSWDLFERHEVSWENDCKHAKQGFGFLLFNYFSLNHTGINGSTRSSNYIKMFPIMFF